MRQKIVLVISKKDYRRIRKAAKSVDQGPGEFTYHKAIEAARAMKRGEIGFKVKA